MCPLPWKTGIYDNEAECIASCTFETECLLSEREKVGSRVYYNLDACKFGDEGYTDGYYVTTTDTNLFFRVPIDKYGRGVFVYPYGDLANNYMGIDPRTDNALKNAIYYANFAKENCPNIYPEKFPAPGNLFVMLGYVNMSTQYYRFFEKFASCSRATSALRGVLNLSYIKNVTRGASKFFLYEDLPEYKLFTRMSTRLGSQIKTRAYVVSRCVRPYVYRCNENGVEYETLKECLDSCSK